MRILTAFAFAVLLIPAALAEADCSKPQSDMTPDEYVACVSVAGAKTLAPAEAASPSGGKTYSAGAPTGAGRGATGVGTSESQACSQAKARAGGNARGDCKCSQKSAGRFECTIATANIVRD